MKSRHLAIFVAGMIGFLSSSAPAADFAIGLKGGMNLARYWGDGDEYPFTVEHNFGPGGVCGAAFQIAFGNMFALQPEMLLSSKGNIFSYDRYYEQIRISYLEIPLLFQLRIPTGNRTVPIFCVGPSIAFKTGVAWYEGDDNERVKADDDYVEMIIDPNIRSTDFGLTFGGGLEIKAGPGKITTDFRYILGLVNVPTLTDEMKKAGMSQDDLPTHRNMAFSFIAGYMFEF